MGYDYFPKISTRQEMYEQLDLAISNISVEEELEDFEYGAPKKYLKTLIIESNSPLEKIAIEPNIQIIPTNDDDIKIIKIIRDSSISFSYLDLLDKRFWTLYSLDTSLEIKREVKRLIQRNNSRLDYAWFCSSMLQQISSKYEKTSFSMKFLNAFANENIPMKKMSIRLWADNSTPIISNLVKNEFIGKGACLSNIELIHSKVADKFIKTRLSMEGSINVSKGNSLEDLLEYQQQIIQGHYRPLIEKIERDFRIAYNFDNGINFKGNLLSIKLKEKISNIEKVSNDLLKGVNPFRFTGFVTKIADDNYLLNILDLHTFDTFNLEFFSDIMLIYLPENTCGNAVLRLFALCQERIDPRAELWGEGHAILAA